MLLFPIIPSRSVSHTGSTLCARGLIHALFMVVPVLTYACHLNIPLKAPGYNILYYEGDSLSRKWGEYLFDHLLNRTPYKGFIQWQGEAENFRTIYIKVDKAIDHDYCIEHNPLETVLKARDENTVIWLIYQFIKQLTDEDNRIAGVDLPPPILQWKSGCAGFDFAYREPHTFSNMQYPEYSRIIGANSVDRDWGIWGHNLAKILPSRMNDSVYAKRGNQVDTSQYCFAGYELFRQLERYIVEHFAESDSHPVQLMIMPNDNNVVCMCSKCVEAGNTGNNATPAVSLLIKRLAERFPRHIFFSTAYRTALRAPQSPWPANTGVMISTSGLSKGIALDPGKDAVKEFLQLFNSWETSVSRVYLWDYAANFDDYLTPLPNLYGLKKQLQFFKKRGVSGIFLNANGYDYSTFDDMKTYVSSALMMNVELSVDSLCCSYLRQFYPVAWRTIAGYYLSLEKDFEARGKPYPMYGSFDMATRSYFNPDTFMPFYRSLNALARVAGEEEKVKLRLLHAALSFTRLQIAYQQGAGPNGFAIAQGKSMLINQDIVPVWRYLSEYCDDPATILRQYKEKGGDLKQYLHHWEEIFNKAPFTNLLIGEKVKLLSAPDEDYPDIDMLNDGILGFDNDYQQGWHICSTDNLVVDFKAANVRMAKKITLRFLNDPVHHIYPPEKIELYNDGKPSMTLHPGDMTWSETTSLTTVSAPVDLFNANNDITIKIYRKGALPKSSLACDEICLQEN